MTEILDYTAIRAAQKAALEAAALQTTPAETAETSATQVETSTESETVAAITTTEDAIEQTDEEILAAQEASETKSESETDKDKLRSTKAEQRIAQLTKEKYELKGRLSAYEQSLQTQQQVELPHYDDPDLPNPNAYPNGPADVDYKLDLRDYERNQAKKAQEVQNKIVEAKAKYPDLDNLMQEHLNTPVSPVLKECITSSDIFGDLYHYLLAHPEEIHKINQMSPLQAARKIGLIEAKLTEKTVETKEPETKVAKTKAPAPITPIKSSTVAAKVSSNTKYQLY